MSTLAGKLVLVTGAGLGIGQGIAIELARQGATVAVHYSHSKQGAQDTLAQIERLGGKGLALEGDLRQVRECFRVVDEASRALGGLDVLVNNAGVTRQADFVDITEETYNEMFDLNMRGYFFCAQRAVPLMLARGGGSIINIGSVHGFAGFSGYSAYGATKGAIAAFTRQLAAELAPRKIRVNALGPGIIEVPRYFDDPEYTTEAGNSAVPIGRVGRPSDIGAAAAFLASDAAEFITGQVFYVDGGSTTGLPIPAKEADDS